MKLEEIKKKKKILILGFGMEGKESLNFLAKNFPEKIFGVADINEKVRREGENLKVKNLRWHLGKDYLKSLKDYDLVVKSPGIPFFFKEIREAQKEGKLTSQTEIFFDNFQGKIIGVTGSKGKSTTTKLIYEILKTCQFKVKMGGNIKKPVLDCLRWGDKNSFFVYELSSHQLYNLKKSPHVAVLLDIFPEHLDYYKTFKEYLWAKANITRYQTKEDYLIFSKENRFCQKIAQKSLAKKIGVTKKLVSLKDWGIKKIPPLFRFYSLNLNCALAVAKILAAKREKVKKAILNFKFLPHRLEFVGKFKSIEFYNDSASTNPEATIFAIDCLERKLSTLILGGLSKRLEEKRLVEKILKSSVKNLILFPETGISLFFKLFGKKKFRLFLTTKLKEAVEFAFEVTPKGKAVLFSPAAASFNLFQNFQERGDQFKKWVKFYGRK